MPDPTLLFEFNSTALRPLEQLQLRPLIFDLRNHTQDHLQLTGFTCDIGSSPSNNLLGMKRAMAVKSYLVEQGIAAARIETISVGETQPRKPNSLPIGRALNRRVEIRYIDAP